MFGLEKNEKKGKKESPRFLFDLEEDLKSDKKKLELVHLIESRITRLKEQLRTGSSREYFEQLNILLNGYHALAVTLHKATKQGSKNGAKKA